MIVFYLNVIKIDLWEIILFSLSKQSCSSRWGSCKLWSWWDDNRSYSSGSVNEYSSLSGCWYNFMQRMYKIDELSRTGGCCCRLIWFICSYFVLYFDQSSVQSIFSLFRFYLIHLVINKTVWFISLFISLFLIEIAWNPIRSFIENIIRMIQ